MPYNTTERLYSFISLTKEEFPQSEAEAAIERANEWVLAFSPEDDEDERSIRLQPLRKTAELYYAAAEVFSSYAVLFFQSQPPVRLLNVLSMGVGADSPNPVELLASLKNMSVFYRERAEDILSSIKPVTTTIRAGSRR